MASVNNGDLSTSNVPAHRGDRSSASHDNRDDQLSSLIHKLLQRSPTEANVAERQQFQRNSEHLQDHQDSFVEAWESQTTPNNYAAQHQLAFKRSAIKNTRPDADRSWPAKNNNVMQMPAQTPADISTQHHWQSPPTAGHERTSNELLSDQDPSRVVGVEQVSHLLKLLGLAPDPRASQLLQAVTAAPTTTRSLPENAGFDKEIPVKLSREANHAQEIAYHHNASSMLEESVETATESVDPRSFMSMKPQRRTSPSRSTSADRRAPHSMPGARQRGRVQSTSREHRAPPSAARGRPIYAKRNTAWK